MTAGSAAEVNSEICPFINDALYNLTKYDKIKVTITNTAQHS
jgi:hypothetical protein